VRRDALAVARSFLDETQRAFLQVTRTISSISRFISGPGIDRLSGAIILQRLGMPTSLGRRWVPRAGDQPQMTSGWPNFAASHRHR